MKIVKLTQLELIMKRRGVLPPAPRPFKNKKLYNRKRRAYE